MPTYERTFGRFVQSGGVEVLGRLRETSNADYRHRLRAEAFWRRYIEVEEEDAMEEEQQEDMFQFQI